MERSRVPGKHSRAGDGRTGEVGGHAPSSFAELASLLRQRLAQLSPGHQKLARRVLGDPEGCAFMTISELAQAVEVNESTVVRFATGLGLDGYPALARLCRRRLQEEAQMISRFEGLLDLEAGAPDSLERFAAFDKSNIVRTFARIDPADWERAVAALCERRRVYVMGLRKLYSIAYLLSYLLRLVRDDVEHVGLEAGTFPDVLRRLGPEDVFVGASIYRYTRHTVQALRFARKRGALTIALTDSAASPLAADADIAFCVDTAAVSILRSLTAFTSLAQALATAVAARRGTSTRSALLLEEEVLGEFEVYTAIAPESAAAPEVERSASPTDR